MSRHLCSLSCTCALRPFSGQTRPRTHASGPAICFPGSLPQHSRGCVCLGARPGFPMGPRPSYSVTRCPLPPAALPCLGPCAGVGPEGLLWPAAGGTQLGREARGVASRKMGLIRAHQVGHPGLGMFRPVPIGAGVQGGAEQSCPVCRPWRGAVRSGDRGWGH